MKPKTPNQNLGGKSMRYGVVVILDALGTKGTWKNKGIENTLLLWNLLVDTVNESATKIGKRDKIIPTLNAFSDTIIMTFEGQKLDHVISFAASVAATLLKTGMLVDINFRGVISLGYFAISPSMVLGPAVDEAAENYELDNWIGISVTPSIYSFIKRKEGEGTTYYPGFIEYEVPRKSGKNKTMVVSPGDYYDEFDNDQQKMNQFPECKKLIDIIHYQLEKTQNPSGSEKWKNLLDFAVYTKTKKN